jgi:hypothetical protein
MVAMTTWHPLSSKIGTNFADKRQRTQATEFVLSGEKTAVNDERGIGLDALSCHLCE